RVGDEPAPIASDSRQIDPSRADLRPTGVDADKIQQVISNLIANSLKVTRGGGRIRIASDPVDSGGVRRARLRVWDNGKGIAPEPKNPIFQPFTDAVSAKPPTPRGPDSARPGPPLPR